MLPMQAIAIDDPSVCRGFIHVTLLCEHDWRDRGPAWSEHSWGLEKHRVRRGSWSPRRGEGDWTRPSQSPNDSRLLFALSYINLSVLYRHTLSFVYAFVSVVRVGACRHCYLDARWPRRRPGWNHRHVRVQFGLTTHLHHPANRRWCSAIHYLATRHHRSRHRAQNRTRSCKNVASFLSFNDRLCHFPERLNF